MNSNVISAVFDSHAEAEAAVRELRAAGVTDRALSIIARHEGGGHHATDGGGHETARDGTGGLVEGLVGGAGVGALLGIAALAIPGVGPLAAAGAIAASVVPEGAAIGAAVGAATGGLTGLLSRHGVSDDDAGYYEGRINEGGVFVSVDPAAAGIGTDQASDILYRHGGHSATRSRLGSTTQV